MDWDEHHTKKLARLMQARTATPQPKRSQAQAPQPEQTQQLSRAEIEGRLASIEASTASAFRALGLSHAGVDEVRARIERGESVDSLMQDFSTYRTGSTLAREQLALRMGAVTLDVRATRATATKLELGAAPPSLRLPAHERSALAARMGAPLEGAEPRGAGVRSTETKLVLGPRFN
jgi:hypothetical protein